MVHGPSSILYLRHVQLFFSKQVGEKEIILDEEESRHVFSVLRKKEGDSIRVMDGKGGLYDCTIVSRTKKETTLHIRGMEIHDKRPPYLHIAIAPTKNSERTEWFLEKSIELGIEQVSFLNCDHSERRQVNMERMHKIALAACKQSFSFHLPLLHEMRSFDAFMDADTGASRRLIASCETGAPLLDLSWKSDPAVCILIGPEGDFSPREYELAKDRGWEAISLGQKRLRTETAALAVCDRINFIFGL